MAIDKVTGTRKKIVKTVLEEQEEKRKKALPKFDTTYEEELIKQLFEDKKQKLENYVDDSTIGLEETNYAGPFVHHERPDEEWDVPITEEIQYFDPELSYELTGYRPITMEKGLDFDPTPFTEMAAIYNSNGKYTDFPEGTKPYRDF